MTRYVVDPPRHDIYSPGTMTRGLAPNAVQLETLHKFGAATVTASVCDVATIHGAGYLIYPWPTTPFTLEVLSTSADDTAAGTGAREITSSCLAPDGTEVEVVIPTDGTSASAEASPTSIIRHNRSWVSAAGAYAGTTTGNAGTITIRTAGAGQTHAEITTDSGVALGQTQITRFSVPSNKAAQVLEYTVQVDSTKSVDVWFLQRRSFLTTSAPFTSTRLIKKLVGVAGSISVPFKTPLDIPPETDLWWAAKVANGTARIVVDWEALLVG